MPHTRVSRLTAVLTLALIAAPLTAGCSSDEKKTPATTSTTISGPNQGAGGRTQGASGSASATPNAYGSLNTNQDAEVLKAADAFMQAWATHYDSGTERAATLRETATRSLADLLGDTDQSLLPDPKSIGKGKIDKEHSTNTTPVVTYDIDGETYYLLMQAPADDDTATSGDWVASQILQERDFRQNYASITPQSEYTGSGN